MFSQDLAVGHFTLKQLFKKEGILYVQTRTAYTLGFLRNSGL